MVSRALLAINIGLLTVLASSCNFAPPRPKLALFNANSLNLADNNGVLFSGKEPFTGKLYAINHKKDSLFSKEYINGKEDGLQKLWFPNGQLQEIRFFTEGKKTGTHTGYWPNGQKRFQYTYAGDIYEGTQYEWFSNGKMYSKKNYHLGYEDGMQQSWTESGEIKSNYEARNGRNYGNIGKKNCYSIWKDTSFVNTR